MEELLDLLIELDEAGVCALSRDDNEHRGRR